MRWNEECTHTHRPRAIRKLRFWYDVVCIEINNAIWCVCCCILRFVCNAERKIEIETESERGNSYFASVNLHCIKATWQTCDKALA